MIPESQIRQVAVQLGTAAEASQVILFGSYARGEATERSDVDLLVVAQTDLPRHKRAVWVSGNWRVTFRFEGPDAVNVDYCDYH